jgi:hypothetical protein
LAVERIKAKDEDGKTLIRSSIREVVRAEFSGRNWAFVSTVCDEAVNAAYVTFQACLGKWKKGIPADLQFKSASRAVFCGAKVTSKRYSLIHSGRGDYF